MNEKKCIVCGAPLTGRQTKFCSEKCARYHWLNNTWDGLRRQALERDRYTCQKCGRRYPEVKVEVHHILPLKYGGENKLENLITLCHDCHRHMMHTRKNEIRIVESVKSRSLVEFIGVERGRFLNAQDRDSRFMQV